jgi:hypothetical protein
LRKTHVADGTLQTLYPKPWTPGVALLLRQATPGSVEYDVYRNAIIKGSELALETGGKLLGKSSNRFSLLLLRWTGSTSRMCYAIPPNMACSRPTRSDAVFSIGTTEILQLTITEKLWRKRLSA